VWQKYPLLFGEGTAVAGVGGSGRKESRVESTLVTAYFNIASKHSHDNYMRWIETMMSVQDNMVIFTSPDLVETLVRLLSFFYD
jgi:hypothetical protein